MSAGRPRLARPSKTALEALYVKARLPLRATAAALGLSKDTAKRALEEAGIARRPASSKRSQLALIPLELLEKNIAAEGLRAHARRLGVSAPTLLEYVRKARGWHRARERKS